MLTHCIHIVPPHTLLKESSDPCKLPSMQGHFHRFGEHILLLIPHAGPAIPRAERRLAKTLPGLGSHGLSEERMIAIPLPGAIERLQEETRLLHRFEQVSALVLPGDGVTERTRQAAEHTRLEQKDLQRFRLRTEHFSHEELQ